MGHSMVHVLLKEVAACTSDVYSLIVRFTLYPKVPFNIIYSTQLPEERMPICVCFHYMFKRFTGIYIMQLIKGNDDAERQCVGEWPPRVTIQLLINHYGTLFLTLQDTGVC